MPDIIFKKILKTMKRTIGKTRLKPSPANMLLTIPAIYLGFENNYDRFKKLGIDEVYCCSVNDSYVMNAWAYKMGIKNIKLIPDGNGSFTKQIGMLISKDHNGFGIRSWRYMAVITDGVVEKWREEPGINNDGSDDDPYGETMPEKCLEYLAGSE